MSLCGLCFLAMYVFLCPLESITKLNNKVSEAPNGLRYAPSGYWWAGREDATLPEPALTSKTVAARCVGAGLGT